MSKLIAVKFLKAHDRYNAKEVAGFEEPVARVLIAQQVAKLYDESEEAAEVMAKAAEADELAARTAELDARETSLAAREAALAEAGGPPKQGETLKK